MALSFHNANKDMTFVEEATHRIARPNELVRGKTYRVFCVLQNSGPAEQPDVRVVVQHGQAEESAAHDGTIGQPAPVTVPPALNNYPGLAAIEFAFTVPAAEGGVLIALIAPHGRTMHQHWSASAATVLQFRRATDAPLSVAQ